METPAEQNMPQLAAKVKRGVVWGALKSLVIRGWNLVITVIAARILAPEVFGTFTAAITVLAIFAGFAGAGVTHYVMQYRGKLDDVGPTLVTVAIGTGVVGMAVMAGGAPLFASWLGTPGAADSIRLLSLVLFATGLVAVPLGLLFRDFRQDRIAIAEGASGLVNAAALIALALAGMQVMALTLSRLLNTVIYTVLTMRFAKRSYRPGWHREVLPPFLAFGVPLIGMAFLATLISNIDFVVVGRNLGPDELGLYSLAFNVASWPYSILASVVASITISTFARLSGSQVREHLKGFLAMLSTVGFLASACLAGLAQPLILALFGENWVAAAPALVATAIYGALRIPADYLNDYVVSTGRTKPLLWIQVAYLAVLVPVTVACVHVWGIVGAGIAHVIGILLVLLPSLMVYASRASTVGVRSLLGVALPPLAAATAAAVASHLVAGRIGMDRPWLALVAGGFTALITYGVLLGPWALPTLRQYRRVWNRPS